MKTLHIKASKLCEKLFKLERQGRYDEALSEIGDLWRDKNALPDTEGLAPQSAAELILRCGSIFGFIGHNKQIPNSQEKSRNLLTHARNLFIELYDVEKIAECENYLALTYWRTGEINEAEVWLDESFSHKLPPDSNAGIYANLIKSLICLSAGKFDEIINNYHRLADSFFRYADYFILGSFYTNIGAAFEKTGNISKALEFLQKARYFHTKSGHKINLGILQNNIAQIYRLENNFPEAHICIDKAINIFKKIKDRTREGFSLDTKAGIFLAENKFDAALKTVEKAVEILGISENAAYLVETYNTKIKILISMDDITAATFCLVEAVETAKNRIGEEAAENLVKNYETCLRGHLVASRNNASAEKTDSENDFTENTETAPAAFDNLELVLPPSLAMYQDIQGVWINNTHLENAGLTKDSLAVVVSTEKVGSGDLVAIEETENRNVSCGFYDKAFGVVCLEGQDSEPLLFDAEKISVIGKIVGVATRRTPDGKLIVEPLSL